MLGLTGLYARQANEAGWLGLAGYLLFGLFFAHTLPVAYTEAFVLPLLATEAPTFAELRRRVSAGRRRGQGPPSFSSLVTNPAGMVYIEQTSARGLTKEDRQLG